MWTLLDMTAPGLGILSIDGLATLLCCGLILHAVHPACLAAARLGDAMRHAAWRTSTIRRTRLTGLETSSASAIGSGFILNGEALIPGFSIAGLLMLHEIFGSDRGLFQSFLAGGGAGAAGYAVIALLGISAILDNAPLAWTTVTGGRIARSILGLCLLAMALGFILDDFNIPWILSAIGCGMCLRVALLLVLRGARIHGSGAMLWVPAAFAAWCATTAVIVISGPVYWLLRRFVEKPGFSTVSFGPVREENLRNPHDTTPRCYAIDFIEGMKSPA